MKSGKAPGPSGIRADNLKKWYRSGIVDPPDPGGTAIWDKFVTLVQECFRTGELPLAISRSTLVALK